MFRNSQSLTASLMVPCLWAILVLAYVIEAQYPVLHTPFRYRDATVEDMNTGELLPVEAAFHKFFCNRAPVDEFSPCERNLTVYIRQESVNLLLSWVSLSGEFERLPGRFKSNTNVTNSNKIPLFSVLKPYAGIVRLADILEVQYHNFSRHLRIGLRIKQEGVPIPVSTTLGGISTSLTVIRDSTPPKAFISPLSPPVDLSNGRARVSVSFNERIFGPRTANCTPLEVESSTGPLQHRIEASRQCQVSTSHLNPTSIINVSESFPSQFYQLRDSFYVTVDLDKQKQSSVEVSVPAESFWDVAGNVNSQTEGVVIYYRPTVGMPSIDRRTNLVSHAISLPKGTILALFGADSSSLGSKTPGALIGQVASGAVVGTIASSAASGGGSGAPGQSIPFFLLGLVQKLFLAGNVAVADMPDLYVDFAGQLGWSMFNFPSPFEAFIQEESPEEDEDDFAVSETNENRLEMRTLHDAHLYLARVFFWVPLALILLLFIHCLLYMHLIWRQKPIPFIFVFPRMELVFCYWALPAISTAIAGLYRGDKKDALIATWLLIALPGSVIIGNLYLLWCFFYSKNAKHRCANFVVSSSKKDPRILTEIIKDWKRRTAAELEHKRGSPVFFTNGLYNQVNNQSLSSVPHSIAATDSSPRDDTNDSNRDSVYVNYISRSTAVHRLEQEPMEGRMLNESVTGLESEIGCSAHGSHENNELMEKDKEPMLSLSFSSPIDITSRSPFHSPFLQSKIPQSYFDAPLDSEFSPSFTDTRIHALPARHTAPNISDLNADADISGDSSFNNRVYSSGGDVIVTGVKIKRFDSNPARENAGVLDSANKGKLSYWKRRSFKRMASDRLKNKTSNNVAALFNSTSDSHPGGVSINSLASDSPPSQFHPLSTEITPFDNEMSTEDEWSPATEEEGLRSSHHRRRTPAPPPDKKEKQNFIPKFTPMVCSKVPEPIWNFDKLDRIVEEYENSGKTTSEPDLEVIDEARNSDLVQSESDGLTDVPKWQESHPSTSTAARALDGVWREGKKDPPFSRAVPSSDNPTSLEPEPFAETKQRLRCINNECLLDIHCGYLVVSDSESASSAGGSEVEYKHRSDLLKKRPKTRNKLLWTYLGEAVDAGFYSFVFGKAQLKGSWKLTPTRNSSFISQFGYIFEEYRGHPVLYREPTYKVKSGGLDRGKFIPLRVPPVIEITPKRIPFTNYWTRSVRVFQHQIQLLTRLLALLKIVVLGCVVAGVGTGRNSIPQIAVLFVMSLFLFLTLRIAQPYRTRYNMAIALLEDVSDVAFLALAMLLLLGPHHDEMFRRRIGIGMICTELTSFSAIVLDRLMLVLVGFVQTWKRFRSRRPTRVSIAFQMYLRRNRYGLERKYFDLWMIRALKRGLYNRVVLREEFPVSHVISQYISRCKASVLWLRTEAESILQDFMHKIGRHPAYRRHS